LDVVWGFVYELWLNVVDVYVGYLCVKFDGLDFGFFVIEMVCGMGYCLFG